MQISRVGDPATYSEGDNRVPGLVCGVNPDGTVQVAVIFSNVKLSSNSTFTGVPSGGPG